MLYSDAEWSPIKGIRILEPQSGIDASEEYCANFSTGMGAIAFCKPFIKACCGEATSDMVQALLPRDTQIIALELLAVAGALRPFRQQSAGHDILVFCDNHLFVVP